MVGLVEELGSEAFVYAQIGEHVDSSVTAESDVVVRVDPKAQPPIGSRIHLRVKEDSVLLFDAASGERVAARRPPSSSTRRSTFSTPTAGCS